MTRRNIGMQQKEDGPLDRKLERLVSDTLEKWHVPGVSVAVVDGENTWAKVHPFFESIVVVLTTFLGLRHCLLPFYACDPVNTFLCRQHNKSIHGSHNVIPSR